MFLSAVSLALSLDLDPKGRMGDLGGKVLVRTVSVG